MKRAFLFVATNLAVLLVLTVVARITGIDQYLADRGGDWAGLLIFAALFGFGGAIVSLLISKWSAKHAMGVRLIDRPRDASEHWLMLRVERHAAAAGIGTPQVGVFDSPMPNAFATGASRNHALVAVSTGLLRQLNRHEVDAVLAHEVSHIANGDMVTLTLIQGVVNTFVIVLARVLGDLIDKAVFRNESGRGMAYMATVIVAELTLGVLASLIVLWFSRRREFRADAGGAQLAGTANMIGALEALKRVNTPSGLPASMAAFGIAGGRADGLRGLFLSHPPIEARIAALRDTQVLPQRATL